MGIDQFSLPDNFYIKTSAQLLLAPDHQFLYAQLLKRAMQKDLMMSQGVIPLHWSNITPEGDSSEYGALPEKGRLLLANDLPDIFGAKVDMEGLPGLTVRLNRPAYESTTYTQASRRVNPNSSISTTPIAVGSEQNSLTLELFAGPYDQTNSRVAPYAIDKLMAKSGVHTLESIVGAHLKRDFDATLEGFVIGLLDTGTAIYPTGMTAANDATATGQFPMDLDLIARTQEAMDNAKLPTFGDGMRILVITPTQERQLSQDPAYRFESHENREYSSLYPGFVKDIKKFHVFKSTTLTTTANTSSVAVHRAHAIAPGALGVGMGGTPVVAKASDTNYDLQAKLIWQAFMAVALMDSRFVYTVTTSA